MLRTLPLLLLLSLLLPAQRPPGKSTMESALKAWQNAEAQERTKLLHRYALWGDPFRAFLGKRNKDDHHQAEIPDILESLSYLEGRDLLAEELKPRALVHTAWVVPAEEVLVFEVGEEWIALHIDKGHDPAKATLSALLSRLNDRLQVFRPKGTMVETVQAVGKLSASKSMMRGAYPEREYKIPLNKQCTVVLRSVGANAFRVKLGPGFKVARTGQTSLRRLKPSTEGLHYQGAGPTLYPAVSRRVQRYLFRILDGVDPLPTYGTPDEERFAFAEAVQTEVREEKGGRPVLLVSFPHLHDLPYDDFTNTMTARFASRCSKIAEKDLVVWIGGQEPREANRYWTKGKFKAPKGKLLKRIRGLFPEDY